MDYLLQLEKAIIFIENNLCEDIKVEDVAAAAGYSYYHFHRVFEAILGETVGNYIRARRLAKAANDLIYTDKRILDIAIDYQFDSQESFNRAFKKAYKLSPGVYRKNRIDTMLGSKKQITMMNLKHLYEGMTIQPVIKQLPKIKIIGIRDKTTISKNKIPDMWKRFNPRIEEIENRTKAIRGYGICEVDPAFDMTKFNENTESTEVVGVEVSCFDHIPEGMIAKTLIGGKYAVFTHKGKLDTLRMTYDYIWRTWVPCSGVEIDMRDDFEFYDERFLGVDNALSEFDIYIPIK